MGKIAFLLIALIGATARGKTTQKPSPPNPLKIYSSSRVHRITDFRIDSWEAGSIDRPREALIHFQILGRKGEVISDLPSRSFRISLLKNNRPIYDFPESLSFYRGRYQSLLRLPRVKAPGNYGFLIRIKADKRFTEYRSPEHLHYSQKKINVLFILDNSGSMKKNDTGSRRYRAIFSLLDSPRYRRLIDKVAIVGFGDTARILLPFSDYIDRGMIETVLKKPLAYGRTHIPEALRLGHRHIIESRLKRDTIAIFLTDGVTSFAYGNQHHLFSQAGIPIYAMGLKGKDSGNFDEAFLKKVAKDTQGEYFSTTTEVLDTLYLRIVEENISQNRRFSIFPLRRHYARNETIFLEILHRDGYLQAAKVTFTIDGESTPPLWIKKETGKIQGALYPLPIGHHRGVLTASKDGRLVIRYPFAFEVLRSGPPFSLRGKWSEIVIRSIGVHREPFILSHQGKTPAFYRFFFLDLKGEGEFYGRENISVHPNPAYLDPAGILSESIEFRHTRKYAKKRFAGHFVVTCEGRGYLYDIDLYIIKELYPRPLKPIELEKSSERGKQFSILWIVSLWIIALVMIFHVYRNYRGH